MAQLAACVLVAEHWPDIGLRDQAALALAGALLRAGWAHDTVDDFVCSAAHVAGDEEYAERAKAAATGAKQQAGRETTGWPRLEQCLRDGTRVCATARDWLGITNERQGSARGGAPAAAVTSAVTTPVTARPWPQPLRDDAYHGVLGEIARGIEPYIEADSAALLVNLLVAAGVALGRATYFQVGAARHYGVLYAVVVGETGDNKSDSATPLGAVLSHAAAVAWQSVDADTVVTTTPVPPRSNGLSTGEGLLWQLRDARVAIVRNQKTKELEEVVADEGVADKRLLVIEAEFARVLAAMYRESNTLSTIVRDLFDSPAVARIATKNNAVTATGPHVGLIGMITPDELRRKLQEGELANGFANRFLWPLTHRVTPRANPPDYTAVVQAHAQLWVDAVQRAQAIGTVARDADALAEWEDVYLPLRDGGRPGLPARTGMAKDICARAHVQVTRIALIFAALDGSPSITVAHQRAALAVWDYCEASAAYLFGSLAADPLATIILDALGRGRLRREQLTALFSRHERSAAIQATLDTLVQAGRIQRVKEDTAGRPVEWWELLAEPTP